MIHPRRRAAGRHASTRQAERVALVQAHARATLALGFAFVVSALIVAATVRDGAWAGWHLFLVGGLGLAISGATQLFAVTWSAGPAPARWAAAGQRWLLAAGVVLLVTGRQASRPGLARAGGAVVLAAFVLLGVLLVGVMRGAPQQRFAAPFRAYLGGLACVALGASLGIVLLGDRVAHPEAVRDAHVTLNLAGFVGLVVAGTLPFFTATQARVRMHARAKGIGPDLITAAKLVGVVTAAGFLFARHPVPAAAGLALDAAATASLVAIIPRLGGKQWVWAGPRLVQMLAGLGWWSASIAIAATRAALGRDPWSSAVVGALVIGGYAQLLAAALAYLAPVLRGGGHEQLARGFLQTRSWVGLAAANAAAVVWAIGSTGIAGVCIAVWIVVTAMHAVALIRDRGADANEATVR